MFVLSLIIYKLYLKLDISLASRTFILKLAWGKKTLVSLEKTWIKHKHCAMCKEKYELEDQTLNLCEDCIDDFMVFWGKQLKRK